eukprot:TRINITY_DN42891_c0_g1_i1.p1 TRINITY_DN42891_c0_g1~~TRINITY_DN42891_c0_g1_i1.p1  ORF type:complete len:444 (+),score=77.27 TRINITY_DN42891_c0_g1_i1:188-1519(+)
MCIFCERAQAQLADGVLTRAQKQEAEACATLQEKRVRATILTGFLGAGKTTFLNFVLKSLGHGQRIGVVQNEFGSVSIDDQLMAVERSEAEMVVMPNGCLCCRVRGDLVEALRRLAARSAGGEANADGVPPLDNLIIECSGLSEVLPVAQTFFADAYVQAAFKLDGVVCVCDAANFESQFDGGAAPLAGEVVGAASPPPPLPLEFSEKQGPTTGDAIASLLREQLSLSDVCLLNKCDLIDSARRDRISARIREVCPSIKMVPCRQGKVNLGQVLKVGSFSMDTAIALDAHFLGGGDEIVPKGKGFCKAFSRAVPEPTRTLHAHSVFGSVGLEIDDEIDLGALKVWLRGIVETHGDALLRLKGILRVPPSEPADGRQRVIIQGVGNHIEIGDAENASSGCTSRLVFIGRLSEALRAEFQVGFQGTTVTAASAKAAAIDTDAPGS